MRKRRICYAGALGLALAVAIPGSAMGQGVQNIDAGFSTAGNANVLFGQSVSLGGQPSKNGTLRVALFLSGPGPPPSLQTVDVNLPEELTLDGKGLPQCNPAAIEGQPPDAARAACGKSLVGQGFATALGITQPGSAMLFNGTPVGGNPSILVHIFTANVPIVLPGVLRNSPLGSPYGQVLHVPVSTSAGGGVPPGIVVEKTELTQVSKTFKDPTIQKKIKKAKKQGNKKKVKRLKKKLNKTFVSGSGCTDGTLSYRADFDHAAPDPDQSVTFEQPCTS
jgi:hypothetical protein